MGELVGAFGALKDVRLGVVPVVVFAAAVIVLMVVVARKLNYMSFIE